MTDSAGHNRLTALAADIRAAHADVARSAFAMAERALAAGRLLLEAKAAVPHGDWAGWLATGTGLSARTARRYMQLVKSGLETATVADLGIRGAAKSLARTRKVAHSAEVTIKGLVWPDGTDRFHVIVFDATRSSLIATKRSVPEESLPATLAAAGFAEKADFSVHHVPVEQAHIYQELRDFALSDRDVTEATL